MAQDHLECRKNPYDIPGEFPARSKIPACLILSDENAIPDYISKFNMLNALDIASYEWNCICGLQDSIQIDKKCCAKLKFVFEDSLYSNDMDVLKYQLGLPIFQTVVNILCLVKAIMKLL